MPAKILLADKSITIQKVVEMLFSGKEYEVICVSDGESALNEASRALPDVVLADVDLPRLDGYAFASRLRQAPGLSQTPVVLMMSRDDQYDAGRGGTAGIVDHIAKPFESQELIGKVKKALATAVSRPATAPAAPIATPPKPAPAPVAPPPPPVQTVSKPAPAPPPKQVEAPPVQKAKSAVPSDIFGIIEEAPARAAVPAPPAPAEEEVFEVEQEFEVEPEVEEDAVVAAAPKVTAAPPAEPKQQPGLGPIEEFATEQLFGKEPPSAPPVQPAPTPVEAEIEVEAEIVPETAAAEVSPFEVAAQMPVAVDEALPVGQKAVDEMREGLGLEDGSQIAEPPAESSMHSDFVTFESLDMASRVSHEDYSFASAAAVEEPRKAASPVAESAATVRSSATPAITGEMLQGVSEEVIAKIAREVLERVAWEVIPDLAERLIREEIDRLKAGS